VNANRQPQGIPVGGQFAAKTHSEPAVNLRPGLKVDKNAANYFADQVQSIWEAGLQGELTATKDRLTYTAPDGVAFDIHQDGHKLDNGELGWAVDNHDQADVDHPSYGLRYESDTEDLGENVQEALFDHAMGEAFTLNGGSESLDFRQFNSVWPEREPSASASFLDVTTGDDLEVFYNMEHSELTVWRNGEKASTEDVDATFADLVGSTGLDVPGGSPSQQLAWHMERSFRMAAAKPGNPHWIQKYQVAGLDWEDRHDGRSVGSSCTDGPWCQAPRGDHQPDCAMAFL
jgi:hypothetical protein